MSAVAGWVLSILGVVLVGTLVDLMLTKSRLKTFVRSVFATITVLVVVTPIPSLVQGGDFTFSPDLTDTDFTEYASELKIRALERAVERALQDKGITAEVKITGKADTEITVDKVVINLSNSGIPDGDEHIHKNDQVKETVAGYLNIDKGRVTVYDG